MKKTIYTLLLITLLVSCMNSLQVDKSLVGKWVIKEATQVEDGNISEFMFDLNNSIKFSKDGTFNEVEGGELLSGNWKTENGILTLSYPELGIERKLSYKIENGFVTVSLELGKFKYIYLYKKQ